MIIDLILGYVLLVVITCLTVVTFFRLPIRYWNYFQRQWEKKKLNDKRIKLNDYFILLGVSDRVKIIKKVTGQFSLHGLYHRELDDLYNYLYENYDPKSREEKIDNILDDGDTNLET